MDGQIYLLMADGSLEAMTPEPYISEDRLQQLVAEHPDLLSGLCMERWLLVARELGVPAEDGGGGRWAADHVFLDREGVPILVEVKRSSDSRLRREVIGQMLDYASHAVAYWNGDNVRAAFEDRCTDAGIDPDAELANFLDTDPGELDADAFWSRVGTNLRAGRIRMILVADMIPPELRRIVEFLNEQMNPAQVLAIEIRQFAGRDVRTLVPTVHGGTLKGARKALQATRRWDEASFMEDLRRRHGEKATRIAERLLDWLRPRVSLISWGEGVTVASFVPILLAGRTKYHLFRCSTDGPWLQIYFDIFKRRRLLDEEERRRLRDLLNEIRGVNIPADAIDRYPSIPLMALETEESFDHFCKTFNPLIDRIHHLAQGKVNGGDCP